MSQDKQPWWVGHKVQCRACPVGNTITEITAETPVKVIATQTCCKKKQTIELPCEHCGSTLVHFGYLTRAQLLEYQERVK